MDKIEKIVELVIELDELEDENFDDFGVDLISLVKDPAIEVDFQYFNKEKECDGQCDTRQGDPGVSRGHRGGSVLFLR